MLWRWILALVLGPGGIVVLLGLGFWQVDRLEWKQQVLAEINARLTAEAVALPAEVDPEHDLYLPVAVEGRLSGDALEVLVSRKQLGAGYRIIEAFETADGRRILIDRGFLPEAQRNVPRPPHNLIVSGNLHWPQEVDSYTPAPDARTGLWFARDLPAMAEKLQAEPILLVARSETGDGIEPMPVGAELPNDHLHYAITWFSLAAIWTGMTAALAWRIRRKKE